MAKKDTKTFAQRATDLRKTYSRAEFDEIERKELNDALRALRDEQEAYREANGMNEQEAKKCGGKMFQFGGGLTPAQFRTLQSSLNPDILGTTGPQDYMDFNKTTVPPIYTGAQGAAYNQQVLNQMALDEAQAGFGDLSIPEIDYGDITTMRDTALDIQDAFDTTQPELLDIPTDPTQYGAPQTSVLPSIISGGVTALGNIGMALMDRDPRQIQLARYTPEQISFARSREAARRRAARAGQFATTAAGDISSPGARYANIIGARTGIERQLGEQISGSLERESLANVEARNRAAAMNAEIANRERMFNLAQEQAQAERQRGYVAGAIEAVPQTMRDIRAIQQQDIINSLMGKDYGLYEEYDPSLTYLQRAFRRPRLAIRPRASINPEI